MPSPRRNKRDLQGYNFYPNAPILTLWLDQKHSVPTRLRRRGWPGGRHRRHATPTELKMRSVIIAISVNFATSPAKSM